MKKIFFIALFIRLICLYLFRNVTNYDLQSYLQVGELTLKRINIYPNVANLHHPYLPLFLYIEAVAFRLGEMGDLRGMGVMIIKFVNIAFDLGILYLVYLLSRKNLKTTFLYAVNPVTILITTLHGQFDVIPVFFLLLSIHLLNKRQDLFSVLSFSFAVLTKTWPILFVIPITRRLKNKKLIILIIFFPFLFVFFYRWLFKSSLIDMGETLAYYQGLWGIWGVWPTFAKAMVGKGLFSVFWQKITTLLFLVCFFGHSWLNRERNTIKNILKLLFFFFIFTTNFSIQYFAWLIPFLILTKPRKTLQPIILITLYLFPFYYYWLFCASCKITPSWIRAAQNIIGFVLWLSFIRTWYQTRKI